MLQPSMLNSFTDCHRVHLHLHLHLHRTTHVLLPQPGTYRTCQSERRIESGPRLPLTGPKPQ